MDKIESAFSHSISVVERKNIVISGVKKIENFDSDEFFLETNMGFITIKGKDLEIIKLDTFQGNVSIKGQINGLNYTETLDKKNKDESFFSKLFKWFYQFN